MMDNNRKMDDITASQCCELGRKEYWEDFYSKELENFSEYGDEGDVWFGKKNVQRILNWLQNHNVDKNSSVLDVGCGNGYTLISLDKKGYTDLTGIDYASEAIELAKHIAKNNRISIKLDVVDFLSHDIPPILNRQFHIIIDKGTYDAVCLSPVNTMEKRVQYVNKIEQILNVGGYFILLSCNWTKEELLGHFESFTLYDEMEIPNICFGGKTGQTVTAIVLKKIIK